eukprot:1155220-Pelagomonas_calceolata.AAC.3
MSLELNTCETHTHTQHKILDIETERQSKSCPKQTGNEEKEAQETLGLGAALHLLHLLAGAALERCMPVQALHACISGQCW